ncbi:MAG: OmpA family protein [Pirellulales bacterium]|nr:OmpA family protein [Pirellulales bacterium]
MPGVFGRLLFAALAVVVAAGCQGAGAPPTMSPEQMAMMQQQQVLQTRASSLDLNNQELEVKLAQSQQQNRLIQDQLAVMREQLNSTAQQLAQAHEAQTTSEQNVQAMTASLSKRSSAAITANSSLERNLPKINIHGIEVRQDGDVVRIELPADRLFNPGTAQLRQDGAPLITAVVAEIERAYPNQIIGVEGHCDSDSPPQGMWTSNHQLSMARATAVFDYLTTRSGIRPQQLFTVAHGSNHPVVSNATMQGKARNRRVELVVYPEQWQQ